MSKFRYYAQKATSKALVPTKAIHTNFLRTGKIDRRHEDWVEDERRYLSYEEVAERTGQRLESAGKNTHNKLNSFHRDIKFPEIIFHRTLAAAPHLGYVHVTASKSSFAEFKEISWGFYMANFAAEIGSGGQFFQQIDMRYPRMYFAVAMKMVDDGEARHLTVNRNFRENGLLFRTGDPMTALKNVLLLGAKDEALRKIIRALA